MSRKGSVLNNCYQKNPLLQARLLVFILKPQLLFMKWVQINNKRNLLQEYHLTDNGDTRVVVKYNPVQQSARVTVGDMHRLFFIEHTGSFTGKYLFKNEYGMEVGWMSNDKRGNEGSITIESQQYIFKIDNNPPATLTIYDSSKQQALAGCGLATNISGTSLSLAAQHTHAGTHYLLLSLCWFLFLPIAKENIVHYAASA